MAEAAPCVDKIVNSDASVLSKESKLECDSYHTWPSKVSPVRGEIQSSVEKCSSLDTVQQQDPATTQPMTMEAALASLNISYSPASRCLQEAAPAPAPAPAPVYSTPVVPANPLYATLLGDTEAARQKPRPGFLNNRKCIGLCWQQHHFPPSPRPFDTPPVTWASIDR